ncbi:MAG: ParB N-terminal domain-containing protein [Patescibacteria group bacterium]|nr:ParB N-terminal domain-containing protein [Patescibacteria group bacterium]
MPREKLTPIPKARRTGVKPSAPTGDAPSSAPDLSHIVEPLRPLAVRCDTLTFHPKNPRKHSEGHVADIAASLRVNGQVKNIVASVRTGSPVVVCGNGTLRAALSLGWEWIACSMRQMSEARENELIVIDNVTGADPDWDDALLGEMLKDVDTANDPELDAMLAELAKEQELFGASDKATDSTGSPRMVKCPECQHEFPLKGNGA